MGRAIVRRPAVFLMDEPISNLDAKLRVQMRAEIARLQDRLGVTMVYVTHDQVEAMTMGDRVAVLKDGRLQQIDAPKVIYDRPATVFVAAFIGAPAMNLFAGRINGSVLELGSQRLTLGPDVFARRPGLCRYDGTPIVVGIRPEDFEDRALAEGVPADRCLTATVRLVEALGSNVIVHFAIDAVAIEAGDPDAAKDRPITDTNVVGRFHRSSAVAPG
jgi:multiple sugar transport system ATP-binding protein